MSLPSSIDENMEMSAQNSSQLLLLSFLKSAVINNPHSVCFKKKHKTETIHFVFCLLG